MRREATDYKIESDRVLTAKMTSYVDHDLAYILTYRIDLDEFLLALEQTETSSEHINHLYRMNAIAYER